MELRHGAENPAIVPDIRTRRLFTSPSCLQPSHRPVDPRPGDTLGRILFVRNGLDSGSHRQRRRAHNHYV